MWRQHRVHIKSSLFVEVRAFPSRFTSPSPLRSPILVLILQTLGSMMHPSLCLFDITRAICSELDPCDSLAVALTCKGLLEPGLDSVWNEISSFRPIVGCMPDDLWRREERTTGDPYPDTRIFVLVCPHHPSSGYSGTNPFLGDSIPNALSPLKT